MNFRKKFQLKWAPPPVIWSVACAKDFAAVAIQWKTPFSCEIVTSRINKESDFRFCFIPSKKCFVCLRTILHFVYASHCQTSGHTYPMRLYESLTFERLENWTATFWSNGASLFCRNFFVRSSREKSNFSSDRKKSCDKINVPLVKYSPNLKFFLGQILLIDLKSVKVWPV